MKKLFLLAACCFAVFAVKAQDTGFEEAVKYLKNKLADCKVSYWPNGNSAAGYNVAPGDLRFDQSGNISYPAGFKFNIFDLQEKKDAISVSENKIKISIITENHANRLLAIETAARADVNALALALKHLWNVCVKKPTQLDR